jgi:hypothetical protein
MRNPILNQVIFFVLEPFEIPAPFNLVVLPSTREELVQVANLNQLRTYLNTLKECLGDG